MTTPLISPESLSALIKSGAPVKIVDASFSLPGSGADPVANFIRERIPGAVFFDIEAIADKNTALPHMLPKPEVFAKAVSALGLGNDDQIILYGQSGTVMGPARAWWSFRVFGHTNVMILDGGLPLWQALGLPLETTPPTAPRAASFQARFRPELVCASPQVMDASQTGSATILDARAASRFAGAEPEPRPGLRRGHIPNSRCLPCANLIDLTTGRMKPPEEIEAFFRECGITPQSRVIASCGSGVTACVLALGLAVIGWPEAAVYDGSWAEWGDAARGLPIAQGA